MKLKELEKYEGYIKYIEDYKKSINASTGSKFDSNANVENKNVTTCTGELYKGDGIGINRLLMTNKLTEMYGEDDAVEFIRQLEEHEIYHHDETNPILPYCVSITMYPFICSGLKPIGGISEPPTNLQSFAGSFINLVFAVASQFAGAVATPEYLSYMDYFIRKEYGDEYYKDVDKVVVNSQRSRTLDELITDYFQQITYSLNQPAAARNFQSVFWNIAYFDEPYFKGMFEHFRFPDGSEMNWDSVSWLQERHMKWLNDERLKNLLTFPVETVNLLSDGEKYIDEKWFDIVAQKWAEGHSFFLYNSDSVDSLASCCFRSDTHVLIKSSSNGVELIKIKDLHDMKSEEKKNLTVFHNGSWVSGKTVKLPSRSMYKVTTANKKEIYVTDNHINPTLRGDIETCKLTSDDYLLFNNNKLDTFPERDLKLTYEQGFLVGMYLGDGSKYQKENFTPCINLSLNKEKYLNSIEYMEKSLSHMGAEAEIKLGKEYNNVYPVTIRNKDVCDFIEEWVFGNYSYEKELNLDCLMQSFDFRKGILDGLYLTDGGNSNRIYTTSEKMAEQLECLITSLGYNSIIDTNDRTDEKVVIRGQEFKRNYPLHCIRWYSSNNRRSMKDVFVFKNNCTYFKISSIEKIENNEDFVYCFEMKNQEEPYFTLPNGIITHNCRLKNELQDNTFSFTLGAGGVATGSKDVITTNINRMIQNASKRGISIEEASREQVLKTHKYLTAYNEIIKDLFNSRLLPVFDAGFISLEKQFLTIGVNGFVEGAEFLGIKPRYNEDYKEYCMSILKPIYEENKNARTKELMFNTEFVPAENLGVKNSKWDKEAGYFSPRDIYNSYFYDVEDEDITIIEKIKLHGREFNQFLDGGSALHLNLSEHLTKDQYKHLMLLFVKYGCSYATINVMNTECPCGYISKHTLKVCPKCLSEDLDYATRIIGYLKKISKFSLERQKEAKVRHYHHVQ